MTTFPIPPRNGGEWVNFAQRLIQQLDVLQGRIGENQQVPGGETNGNDSTYIALPGGGSVVVPTLNNEARMGEKNIAANAITANKIAANAVDANKINANNLSAISADLGSINAGSLTSVTVTSSLIQTSSSGDRVVLDDVTNTLRFFNSSGSLIGQLGSGVGGTIGGTSVDLDMTGQIVCSRFICQGLVVGTELQSASDVNISGEYKISSSTVLKDNINVTEVLSSGGILLISNSITVFEGLSTGSNRARLFVDGALRTVVRDSNGFLKA